MLASLRAVMTPEETNRLRAAARCIQRAENGQGRLSRAQRRDVLVAGLSWVLDSEHAERILAAVEDMYPFSRSGDDVLVGVGVGILKPNWATQQTVFFADGRKRVRNVHCLDEKTASRVGEVWIGDRMVRVIEVEFGVWREEKREP